MFAETGAGKKTGLFLKQLPDVTVYE